MNLMTDREIRAAAIDLVRQANSQLKTRDDTPDRLAVAIAGFRPPIAAAAFYESEARFTSGVAGVRGGKTFGGARAVIRRVIRDMRTKKIRPGGHRGLLYWCVAPTYDLSIVQFREIIEIVTQAGVVANVSYSWPRAIDLVNGTRIEFRSAHRPERLVGAGLDGVWIDEVARVDAETWKGQLRQRLSDRAGWGVFTSTPLGRNWFYKEIYSQAANVGGDHADYESHTWRTADNTYIPGIAEEVAKARGELPGKYFRREYEASFDEFIGQVYDEFSFKHHVVSTIPAADQFVEKRAGVDWGFRNPGVVLVGARDKDNVWWIIHEEYAAGLQIKPPPEHDNWTKRFMRIAKEHRPGLWLCDTADPENISAMRAAGVPVKDADKHVLKGIESVAKALHVRDGIGAGLRIHKSCAHLIEEIQSYQWRESSNNEEPEKENDHCMDALRYLIHYTRPQAVSY